MLFDLRGRGRRRTVKVIYIALALLLGGSLVGFGIGSNTSGGGLFDALLGKDGGGGGTSPDKTLDKQIANALEQTRLRPRDPAAWSKLSALRYQRASVGGGFRSPTGRSKLVLATQAWERYLALSPRHLDKDLALQMSQAYGINGVNQPVKAFRAMRIVTAETKPPSSNLYQRLAVLAYYAHQTTTGDLAADKAVQLVAPAMRTQVRAGLKQAKADPLSVLQRLAPAQPTG